MLDRHQRHTVKENFKQLLREGMNRRELYLARAYLLDVPYHTLERKSNDQVEFYWIERFTLKLLDAEVFNKLKETNKLFGKEVKETLKEKGYCGCENWIRCSIDEGKTICGGGWMPEWRTETRAVQPRRNDDVPTPPLHHAGLDGCLQHDSCPPGRG